MWNKKDLFGYFIVFDLAWWIVAIISRATWAVENLIRNSFYLFLSDTFIYFYQTYFEIQQNPRMVPYQNLIVTNRALLEVNQGMKKSRKTDWLFMNQRTKSETGWWLHSLKVKMGLISNISLVEVRWAVTTPWSGFLHVQDSSIIWPPPSTGFLHQLASYICDPYQVSI